jgi:hypothetical protein
MRRLARAYQARLNFYLIDRGELPDYEGAAAGRGEDGRGIVVGAVSALRAKQPFDFTFDPHSELSVEKLKDWIDQFLAGKLKKVATAYLFVGALIVSARCSSARSARCCAFCCHRRDHRSKSCRTVTRCRSTTRSEPCTLMTSQSGTKLWAIPTLLCSRCAREGKHSHPLAGSSLRCLCLCVCASSKQLEQALELDPRSPVLHYNMGQAREVIGEMEGAIAEYKLSLDNDIRYMDGALPSADKEFNDASVATRQCCNIAACARLSASHSAYHSLARAISVLGDAESAVNILQVRAIPSRKAPAH